MSNFEDEKDLEDGVKSQRLLGRPAWMVEPETMAVMGALNSEGYEARFVGGCVRDTLVNRKTYDIDIAINAEPEKAKELLSKHKIKCIPTGIAHGTVTAVINGKVFEVTSLREDVKNFGRYAEVKFTDDWETDARRRDFTINAIYADMYGNVYDYLGGVEDLRLGRLRFIGNAEQRIKEDYLRILRYFRFFACFAKSEPDPAAIDACKKYAEFLSSISVERITSELVKILSAPKVVHAWQLMKEAEVLDVILDDAVNVEKLSRLVEIEEVYENMDSPMRRLAALLSNVEVTIGKLRLSSRQTTELFFLMNMSKDVDLDISDLELCRLVYHEGNDIVRSLLLLVASDSKDMYKFDKLYNLATSFKPPRFPVNGDDVLKEGVEEGLDVGLILSEIERWWVNQDFIPKRVDCLEKLKEVATSYFKRKEQEEVLNGG